MSDKRRIGLREVRALGPEQILYDSMLSGFAVRRQKKDISYVLRYRTAAGRQRWFTIGRHGSPWTPETAREKARSILGEVAAGGDPAADKRAKRKALTVAELCDEYMAEVDAGRLLTRTRRPKTASTIATDRSRIESHIKPLLGRLSVEAVGPDDIESFMHEVAAGASARRVKGENKHALHNVRGGQGAASRTVGLLGAIFAHAVKRRIRADNPVRGIMRPADGRRDRRLSDREYALLGAALRDASESNETWPPALAAINFLALTGWRLGEALGLQWSEIDLGARTARLTATKTGASMRPLSNPACAAISSLPKIAGDFVFPSAKTKRTMAGFSSYWDRIIKAAKLPDDVTPHVLRHSFASVAADLGFSELTIASLLGHRLGTITSRYTHQADATLLAAADAVADEIASRMKKQLDE